MDIATIQAVGSVLMQVIDLLIKYGPTVMKDGETIIADLKLAWASATSGTPITADQQTQIDAALASANDGLAAAYAAQQGEA